MSANSEKDETEMSSFVKHLYLLLVNFTILHGVIKKPHTPAKILVSFGRKKKSLLFSVFRGCTNTTLHLKCDQDSGPAVWVDLTW